MANAKIQIKGLEALQEKLKQKREVFMNALQVQLLQLGEQCVTYSKDNKGYSDRTANLKNSISFALFLDGELVSSHIGQIPKPEETKQGQAGVSSALDEFAANGVVAPKGYTIIVVAGMKYGAYVEHKGYNVLHLTKYYMKDEMRKILEEVVERIKNS